MKGPQSDVGWRHISFQDLPFAIFWYLDLRRRSPNSLRYYRELIDWQGRSPESITHGQFKLIHKMILHAYDHSPYYRERMKGDGIDPYTEFTWDVFRSIPVLKKRDIQDHLDSILSDAVEREQLIKDTTGGSTGEPLTFFHDGETKSWFEACDLLVKFWWGIAPWCRKAFLWGADRDIPEWKLRQRMRLWLERSRFLNSFDMTSENMDDFFRLVDKWEPAYLQGYSSSLSLFSKYLQEKGLSLKKKPIAIRSSAETLFPVQRDIIGKTLSVNLFNFYGSREIPNIASECQSHKGLHVFSPIRYVEILDRSGNRVQEGESGRIVITDLNNYSMPFVRYEIGDIGMFSKESCNCGITFPLLQDVQGRTSDFIVTRNGSYIHGEYFTHLFYGIAQVRKFQVLQKEIDKIKIYIVSEKSSEFEISMNRIRNLIMEKMGKGTEIEIIYVESIPPTKSGKFRFTISEVEGAI